MTDFQEIEDQVRTFILDSFLTETAAEKFENDDDLLRMLDSLQVLRMVIAFEGLFGIKIEDSDLTVENLGSVRNVAALVVRKSKGAWQPDRRETGPGIVDQPRTSSAIGG
jgi:acyl carrier protein